MRKKIYLILPVMIILAFSMALINTEDVSRKDWKEVNQILGKIKEPDFPSATFNIMDFGASRDSSVTNTTSIQSAIDECSRKGGGRVIIPEGKFLTGAIHLRDNVNLHLEKGATLTFSTNPDDYLPLVITRWEGMDCYNYSPLIYANSCVNIAVTGEGILDGQANASNWWPWKGRKGYGWEKGMPSQMDPSGRPALQNYEEKEVPVEERLMGENSYLRPQFINFYNCKNILLEDITIKNSPFWLIHPLLSENITVRNITADSHGPNNDGIDPESSRYILVEKCFFNTGDDCIAIKSGRNKDGRRAGIPSECIVVRDCIMKNGHGGIVLGSEISGGVRKVFVENCKMDSPELDRAIRIKTNSNRGGIVEDIYIRNIEIGQVKEAVLKINCVYDIKNEGEGSFYPEIKNVYIEKIISKESEYPVYLQGIEDQNCIDSIHIVNSRFEGVEKKSFITHTGYVDFDNVEIRMKEKSHK